MAPKRRGRPRAYQPDVALGKALDLFRKDGFAATSLDDLSAATGMNRPSLYGAFGDKRELFIKSYQRYRDDARAAMGEIFRDELPIRQRLGRIYAVALDIYLSGEAGPRGCFTLMTAASEAVADPDIRAMVREGLTGMDKAFAACFRRAKEQGELPAAPIRPCWRNSPPPPFTRSPFAPARERRARSWRRSSMARRCDAAGLGPRRPGLEPGPIPRDFPVWQSGSHLLS